MKTIKILLVAGMALFMTLAVLGNVTMSDVGLGAIGAALGMETTFKHPAAMWRAITNPNAIRAIFGAIVLLEALCALLLWRGVLQLWRARGNAAEFVVAKRAALLGLGAVACLYFIGWLVVCNEWFLMWQSQKMNVLPEAFWNFASATLIMLWLKCSED